MRASCIGKLVGSLVLLVALGAQAGDRVLDKIQILRSESFRACASILLSYDPYSRSFDRGKSSEHLTSLDKIAEVIGDPGLSGIKDEYTVFSSAIKDLESRPRDVPVNTVNNILAAQEKLVAVANGIYSRQVADKSSAKKKLHDLSVVSGKMLLLYQIRPYGGLVSYPGILLDGDVMSSIDAEISTGLDALRKSSPESALDVDAIQRNYAYVRPMIFDAQKKFVADGVNYYLGKNISRLDALAGRM